MTQYGGGVTAAQSDISAWRERGAASNEKSRLSNPTGRCHQHQHQHQHGRTASQHAEFRAPGTYATRHQYPLSKIPAVSTSHLPAAAQLPRALARPVRWRHRSWCRAACPDRSPQCAPSHGSCRPGCPAARRSWCRLRGGHWGSSRRPLRGEPPVGEAHLDTSSVLPWCPSFQGFNTLHQTRGGSEPRNRNDCGALHNGGSKGIRRPSAAIRKVPDAEAR